MVINSCNLFAQNLSETPNLITKTRECEEFGYLADMYFEKASMGGIYAEKYLLISDNFKKMHRQCLEEINKHKSYSGYRINAQQLMSQSQKEKK